MKAALIFLLILAGCNAHQTKISGGPEPSPGMRTLAVPKTGAYTGAYIDFGDKEDGVTLEKIEAFEKMVGKHQAIVASSSYWGEQTFPTDNVRLITRHGSIPLIYWSPWDRPYTEHEDTKPASEYLQGDKFSLTRILSGEWDTYIDKWADAARAFGEPMFVSFCNEMNGTWFPWSGSFYGASKELKTTPPETYEGPEVFKKAWRYVVDRVRARGAANVIWIFHVMNYSIPQDVWNTAAQYYPGADYVDWLGLSVYGQQDRNDGWAYFSPRKNKDGVITGGLLDWPYQEMTELDPVKPIMLAEWGVGEYNKIGSKAEWIREGFRDIRKYPRIKAAVFWHERWQNEDDSYSNLRVNSSPDSLKAYRQGVADPFWLDYPLFESAGK